MPPTRQNRAGNTCEPYYNPYLHKLTHCEHQHATEAPYTCDMASASAVEHQYLAPNTVGHIHCRTERFATSNVSCTIVSIKAERIKLATFFHHQLSELFLKAATWQPLAACHSLAPATPCTIKQPLDAQTAAPGKNS